MYAIHGTISFQSAKRGPKGEENRETHSTVNVVIWQRERRGKHATDRGSTVFEHPTQLLGLNRLINPIKELHFFPSHLDNDPIPAVLSINNGPECITSLGVEITLLVLDTYCGKRLVTFAEQSRSWKG
jgi:hypothetical protein